MPIETSLAALLLVATLGIGAYWDWRRREVDDRLWVVAGLGATALGGYAAAGVGPLALGLWLLLGAFVLQHMLPWDVPLERLSERLPGAIEAGFYVVVGLVLLAEGWTHGLGPAGLPLTVVSVFVSVLAARVLFELGVLYGGADAKALMVAGLILPLFPDPWVPLPTSATSILGIYPFTLTMLMDAALFAVVVPLGLAGLNLRRGSFEWGRAFTSFRLAVADLPHRFVWVRDPTFHPDDDADVGSSEEDEAMRARQARELAAAGVTEIWVTPQLPFVVFLWAGAVAGILLGNLLFDLLAVL